MKELDFAIRIQRKATKLIRTSYAACLVASSSRPSPTAGARRLPAGHWDSQPRFSDSRCGPLRARRLAQSLWAGRGPAAVPHSDHDLPRDHEHSVPNAFSSWVLAHSAMPIGIRADLHPLIGLVDSLRRWLYGQARKS